MKGTEAQELICQRLKTSQPTADALMKLCIRLMQERQRLQQQLKDKSEQERQLICGTCGSSKVELRY